MLELNFSVSIKKMGQETERFLKRQFNEIYVLALNLLNTVKDIFGQMPEK